MDHLSVGMHVEIMRSDGRVHGALVTQLNNVTKSASVEWFEKVLFWSRSPLNQGFEVAFIQLQQRCH